MIDKLIDVERHDAPDAPAYHQQFRYQTDDEGATVATALRELNERAPLLDAQGREVRPIRWECNCLQRKCGACAMVVNGVPRAACDVRLSSLRGERVTLAPLRKFPLVADLVVDRHETYAQLARAEAYLEREVELPVGRKGALAYEASRCLQCGCCLEVCPNFCAEGPFGGMATMVPLARLLAETTGEERTRLARTHRQMVFAGCGKSLACRDVCPAGIDLAHLMARSNAAALWRRFA